MVLRRIFGPNGEREWKGRDLCNLYSLPDIIRVINSRSTRWAGHVAHREEMRKAYTILVGIPEGKRPLGKSGHRWEDNIKMDFREMGFEDVGWNHLAGPSDRLL
jgi:hypothetical protein